MGLIAVGAPYFSGDATRDITPHVCCATRRFQTKKEEKGVIIEHESLTPVTL
jgi:hypothetical protein